MTISKILHCLILLAIATVILPNQLKAQCEDDQTPPVAICLAGIQVQAIADENTTIWAQDVDAGSFDACTANDNLEFRLELSENGDETVPETTSIDLAPEAGSYYLNLWVGDEAGNWNACFTEITVLDPACPDDAEAPEAICTNASIRLNAPPAPEVRLLAASLGLESTDNCDAGLSFLASPAGENTSPSGQNNYFFTEVGVYELDVWVIDDNGNFSSCISEVTVNEYVAPDCNNDQNKPIPYCINGLVFDTNVSLISAASIDAGSYDDCTDHANLVYRIEYGVNTTGEVPETSSVQLPNIAGFYPITFWVGDASGNWDFCTTFIELVALCENDSISPVAVCIDALQASAHPIDGITIWPQDIDEGSFDLCSEVTLELSIADGFAGVEVNEGVITFPPIAQEYVVTLNVTDEQNNTNFCWTTIDIGGTSTYFKGQVFIDDNSNCTLDQEEQNTGFQGWLIRATDLNTGVSADVFTDENGFYELNFITASTDNLQIEVLLPDGQSSECSSSFIHSNASGSVITQNFPVISVDDCAYLTVDVGTFLLRRCFENSYFVSYSNYSGFEVEDATIELTLDPFMTLVDAELPYDVLDNGHLLFDLGNIPALSGGFFHINVQLSCEADLGATHCVEAKILPFDCVDEQYAELRIEGECDEDLDVTRFKISNIGTSAMTEGLNAIIVEDVIMYMHSESIDLDAGESIAFNFPANGATWRYELEQDASFPFGGIAAAFVEGCGGFTPEIATQFPLFDSNPNRSLNCQENVGSWDPNDKQAFPRGRGDEHFIEANTPIEYLIRFQNTGTDTAFNIVIEDQLSEWLDPTTLRPGSSSHAYRLEQKENGLLLFHFDNIMLPDSTINELASNGFVKFSIDQMQDLPLGTFIDNTANIYFDFNEAVVTNTVRHTLGENMITLVSQEAFAESIQVSVYPNPLKTEGWLILEDYNCKKGQLQVVDTNGRTVQTTYFSGSKIPLNRKDFISAGLYFFRILDEGQLLSQGKLMVH